MYYIIENGHSFEWNEDPVTVFLKWTDISYLKSFSQWLEPIFVMVGQNNFGNKINTIAKLAELVKKTNTIAKLAELVKKTT